MRKKITDDDTHTKVIDLASTLKEAQDESKTYICSECSSDLVYDKTYRLRNPFGGEGYYCSNVDKCPLFGKVLDISLQKLAVKPKPVKGTISSLRDANQEVKIDIVTENKGMTIVEDEYQKYDPEPGEDERLRLSLGAEIMRSEIILTDSSGMDRTMVKRNTPKSKTPSY
jgi:hypothetical protein